MTTWFITGASQGIGLGLCKELLAAGQSVVGSCRNPDGARDLWELASDFKSSFRLVQLDVADENNIAKVAADFAGQKIDVLVNNAGVLLGASDSLLNLKFADVRKSFEVNTIAPMLVVKALLPALQRSTEPKIVNISTKMASLSDNTSGGYFAYRMSKSALNMFNRSLSFELPKVTCLVLHPGWVQTQMGGQSAPIDTHESAQGLVKVIQGATLKDSGKFLDFQGRIVPW
jgi:NAD(P)-dependent dehydrogenase (short-subunit alcohol dehydrogenase family)